MKRYISRSGATFGVPPKVYKGGPGGRPPVAGVFHGMRRQSRTRRKVRHQFGVTEPRTKYWRGYEQGAAPPRSSIRGPPHANKACIKFAKKYIKNEKGEEKHLALIYLRNALAAEPAKVPAAPAPVRTALEPALTASDHFFQS